MFTETEGIILRQIKIAGGRRIVLLFSDKYGKISAGTGLNERGNGKNALAVRPFTYGRYELFKKGDFVNINGGESIDSHYSIGEDVDKFMEASFALEFLDKITEEQMPATNLFFLTKKFLAELERRKERCEILVIAFMLKAVSMLGYAPVLDGNGNCKTNENIRFFNIPDGGVFCEDCPDTKADGLIYRVDFDIVNVLKFMLIHPLEDLRNLAVKEELGRYLRKLVLDYAKYHLDIGDLKSESFIIE